MNKNIELYKTQDGFYAGTPIRNGKMSKNSHRITDEEIMTMFSYLFKGFCEKYGQDKMFMQTNDGTLLCVMKTEIKKHE